jgi:Putative restriction endonuclease
MAHQLETEVFYPESDGQLVGETDVHRQLLMDLVFALSRHFADRPTTYVTGSLFLYYVKGNPRQVVCPDVCIAFDSTKRLRNIHQTWRDGPFPQVIIELTSASTRAEDLGPKRELYEWLGTLEYYLFDPHFDPGEAEPDAVEEPGDLRRFSRPTADLPFGPAETVTPGAVLHSPALGLGFTVRGRALRVIDEATGQPLPTAEEEAEARQAEAEARQAEAEARQAAEARAQELADEVARLRAELERQTRQ